MATQIFVNLAVRDLDRSKDFFIKLGYAFDPQFTDEKAASLVISDTIYVMLLTEPFFKGFIPGREIADPSKVKEVLNAISVDSREGVDAIYEKAIAAGATKFRDGEDYGWMYSKNFEDLDGHVWEYVYMDLSKVPAKA